MLPSQSFRGLLALAFSSVLLTPSARAQDLPPSTTQAEAGETAPLDAPESEPAADPSQASVYPEAGTPAEVAADDGRLPRLKVHAAGLGYHSVLFRTESGDGYAIHGPSVVYDYFVGRRFGFAIHGEAFFTAFGRESGENDFRGPLFGKYADRHSGMDTTFMVAYRTALSDALTLFLGAGAHWQTFTTNGSQYRLIEIMSTGLGVNARLQWNFHPLLTLNAGLFVAVDPFDMIAHVNPAVITAPMGGAVGVGVRY